MNNFHSASLIALDARKNNLSRVLRLTFHGKLPRQFVVQNRVWTKLLFGL